MISKSYTQLTLRIPTGKDSYRQAVECIENRDRAKYRTQAEYITAAILALEGRKSEEMISMGNIAAELHEIKEKIDRLCHEQEA